MQCACVFVVRSSGRQKHICSRSLNVCVVAAVYIMLVLANKKKSHYDLRFHVSTEARVGAEPTTDDW